MFNRILSMLVIIGMVCFVQCTDEPIEPTQDTFLKAGKGKGGGNGGGGGGGGGHTETAGNNLSFPAFLVDGYSVTPIAEELFTVEYDGEYPGLTPEQKEYCQLHGPWYPQKTEGNVWQAYNESVSSIDINWIDWGDMIEAVDPKIGRPYRLELVLYVDDQIYNYDALPVDAFIMAELEYPSSSRELQGANEKTYECHLATVVSPYGKIVVQNIDGIDPSTLVWNEVDGKWDGGGTPVPVSFAVENNVGGKLIFGASQGGWKPSELGDFRITFYVDSENVDMTAAKIGNYAGDGKTVNEVTDPENNLPVVDAGNNLTYVDVTVTAGGGGGGGNH